MKRHARLRFSLIALLGLCVTSVSAQANPNAVAIGLRSTDRAELARALQAVSGVSAEEIAPSVRTALAQALERANGAYAEAGRRMRAGNPAPVEGELGELRLDLLRVARSLRDPEMIPALAGAMDTGLSVTQALAEFGERAAADVLRVVMSPDSDPLLAGGGLITLRFMLELGEPLSDATLNAITSAAEWHLGTTGDVGITMSRAIGLAAVLSDPQLDDILRVLASDPAEVAARGVNADSDLNLVERVQQTARQALEGVPPLPRLR